MLTKCKCEVEKWRTITHSSTSEGFDLEVCVEIQRNVLHVLCNYEPMLQNEESFVQGVVFPTILPALL